jgi:hypothetical protein
MGPLPGGWISPQVVPGPASAGLRVGLGGVTGLWVTAGAAAAGLVFVLASWFVSGCGTTAVPSAAELDSRAERTGVAMELIYVTELKGYHRATGGMGVYGDDGFQDIYVSGKGDVRLTVERRALTAANCPAVPIAD